MTEPKTELEELKALQKQSQELTRKREKPIHKKTDSSPEHNVKTTVQDPGMKESFAPSGDHDETVEGMSGQIETLMSELEEAVAEHPSLALLAAFGIGVVVGQLLSRK